MRDYQLNHFNCWFGFFGVRGLLILLSGGAIQNDAFAHRAQEIQGAPPYFLVAIA